MKVLHINSYYNGSIFYKNLFDRQKENGIDIDVYVPASTVTDISSLNLGEYTKISLNHSKYDRLLFHVKHNKIYKDTIVKYKIKEYDIIHAHSLFSNGYIAYKLKKEFGIPYVVAVRNTDVNVFFKYMIHLRKLGVRILKEAEKVVFLSSPYRNFVMDTYVPTKLKKEIYDKIEIIPNGIDDFWFENKGSTKMLPKRENLRLVYAGVINKNKNIITTTKAIDILNKKGFNINFTVVGRIGDESIYKQFIDKPYISYISPKPKEALLNIYRTNDIFVMPSITETFGLVYAEAMSQGLPIIYSKGQGFDGQFEDGQVGSKVISNDPKDIAYAIENILENYEKISKSCIYLSEKFEWEKIASKYKNIYKGD